MSSVSLLNAVQRHLRIISRMMSPSTLQTVVVALVLSRRDYANSVLVSARILSEMSAVSASARLIYGLQRFDHVSEALMVLHWLQSVFNSNWRYWSTEFYTARPQNTSDR